MNSQISNYSGLKARVFTASILAIVILFLLFTIPQISFGITSAFLFLFAITEWPRLLGKNTAYTAMAFVCFEIIFMGLGVFLIQITGHQGWVSFVVLSLALLLWLYLFYCVVFYEKNNTFPVKNHFLLSLLGLIIILFSWLGLNIIRDIQYGTFYILFFFFLIWGVDTFAYFAGKRWGTTKITPRVSPKKTWAGVYAALIYSLVLGIIGALSFPGTIAQRLSLIPLSLIIAFFSIIGDLTISALKRSQNVKDTGAILPGHGGLLDRIDSILAGAPIFALGLIIIGLH